MLKEEIDVKFLKLPGILIEAIKLSAWEFSRLSLRKLPYLSVSIESIPFVFPIDWMFATIEGAPGPGTRVVFNENVLVTIGFSIKSESLSNIKD